MKRRLNQGIQKLGWISFITLIGGFTVTGCQAPGGPDAPGSPTPDQYAPIGSPVACDPMGGGSTGSLGPNQGLIANLAYLANPPKDTDDPPYSSVFDFEKQATQISTPVYMSQLDIPTEYFEQGFMDNHGNPLTTADGQKLDQYFSLHIQSVLQLGPDDLDGYYQFAIASDDGAVLSVNDGNGFRILINDDGDHSTKLGCAEAAIKLDHSTPLPITVDYYQGPPNNIALVLLWRKVDPSAQWCGSKDFGLDIAHALNDPYCGQDGNNLFFNWSKKPGTTSTPNSNWNNLLARGWSVVPAQDYYLPGGTPTNPCNSGNQCYTDTFNQPGQSALGSADVLFVTDTTHGEYDRGDAGKALHHLYDRLPKGSDLQVGVMLGDASSSHWHGRLWHAPGVSPTLSSKSLTITDMETLLNQDLNQVPDDYASDEGELGLYSISSSLSGSLLTENQKEGFYRPSAALGVVILSDDADECLANPDDYADCAGITPAGVLAQLQAFKNGKPLSVNAIVHATHWVDPDEGEDEYGAGYIDLAQLAGGQVFGLVNSTDPNDTPVYEQAMQQIGDEMAAQMQATGTGQLLDGFTLTHAGVDPSTISVSVDGSTTQYSYNSDLNQVDLQSAGTYGSVVAVNYCLAPAPSPSTSPSPSPSPSITASPIPGPSASPSPSPSVTPSPSPSCTGPFCGGGVLGQ